MKPTMFFFLVALLLSEICMAQELRSGPMLGYNTMREVAIWLETKGPADVSIRYWSQSDQEKISQTPAITTSSDNHYTATIKLSLLEPGTDYGYEILLNDKVVKTNNPLSFTTQELWQWRTDPKDFSFVAGSCAFVNEPEYDRPGKPYGGDYQIFDHINKEGADFMMWLGDNTYLREVDWNTLSGIQHRFSHSRALPELQPVLSSMHHYAIWDDHDYGPNDSNRSYWGKEMTLQTFKDYWANPNYGVGGTEGITGTFVWNDCQFFLLDNRWYRSIQHEEGQILGEKQIQWLIEALKYSRAPFKFICIGGQFISDAMVYENHVNFTRERQYILDQLDKYNIHGVVFLSGDRHSSEVSMLTTEDDDVFYDVTASPLSSGAYDHSDEANNNRIEGSMIGERNYAVFEVTGPRRERKLSVTFKNSNGEELFKHDLIFPEFRRK